VDFALLLLLFLVIMAVGIAVLSPLRNPAAERAEETRADRLADLEVRKETKYSEIRDAEADFHAGKLSRDDYRELDRALRREAIAILEQIDRVNGESIEEAAQENGRPG
jgi:predicted transcriptional regulator